MTTILKETRSLCPICLTEIDATIIEKNNKVYMTKECSKHGKFETLVEKDVEFYKKTLDEHHVNRKNQLLITFARECNLNCNFCWLPQKDREDFSLEYLRKTISDSSYKNILISGGEPTLRDDLLDIIHFIREKRKHCILITNGLKLANLNYVKKLKDAGLSSVVFSFNTFDDNVYKKLNGRKLLDIKLKALENLKRVGILTVVSVMIVKGVNDKELKKIFDYCIENNSFIKELRIRSSVQLGKYRKSDIFFVSDMITIFSKILNIDRKEFLKIVDKNNPMPHCHFSGLIISFKQNNYIHPWKLINIQPLIMNNIVFNHDEDYVSFKNKIFFIFKILNSIGINTFFKIIIRELLRKERLLLKLEFRSWPNKYNIDLDNTSKRCITYQLSKNGEFPFCYSLILNNENIID